MRPDMNWIVLIGLGLALAGMQSADTNRHHAAVAIVSQTTPTPPNTTPAPSATDRSIGLAAIGLAVICTLNFVVLGIAFGLSRRMVALGGPPPNDDD